MNILNRISRLFQADMHGLLDDLEQPEMILKQALREMQAEIDKAEAHLAALAKQRLHLQKSEQDLHQRIQDLQQQIDFCLDQENEALAKPLLKKRLQSERSVKEISRQLEAVVAEHQYADRETEERKEKLQAIQDKLVLFSEQSNSVEKAATGECGNTVTEDDVELALLYEKQRRDQATAATGEPL